MPKENYGRKGLSAKPNTNAEGSIDEATDPVDPREIEPTNMSAKRTEEAPVNRKATQRSAASE